MTARRPRGLLPVAVLLFVVFCALGTWQVQRRAWKLDLIERVESRVHAAAVPAPGRAHWETVDAAHDEYRHVQVEGRYLDAAATFVQAVTALGPGYWVVTPLQTADGSVVLVNRGYVPSEARPRVTPGGGPVRVTGLLRLTEPGGGFLRHNDPAGNRWYSRDVAAIATARGLRGVAPYFIDAQDTAGPLPDAAASAAGVPPVAGLTVVTFHNSHLVYAITWYTLALMVAGAAWRLRHVTVEETGGKTG